MYYLVDTTEEGKKCEICIKGENIPCIVVCVFEKKNKQGNVSRTYRLMGKNDIVYDNFTASDIKFKK